MQRARERTVRKYKRRYLAEDAAGTDTTDSAVKLRQARQELSDFISATGGRADSARTSVAGFGRSASSKAMWAAKKNSSVYSSLNMEPQPVTMQSIASVKPFVCETLDSTGQRQLQNAHKRLLMVASKQPENVEVGRVFDIKMKPLTKDIIGPARGGSVKPPKTAVPHIFIHTHPDCSVFSQGDLYNFAHDDSIKLLTAVGHNGHIYAIEKTSEYDSNTIKAISSRLFTKVNALSDIPREQLPDEQLLQEAESIIHDSIKEMKKYGIRFYE